MDEYVEHQTLGRLADGVAEHANASLVRSMVDGIGSAQELGEEDVRRMVASWTGEYQYTIDQVLEAMLKRANELNLRLSGPEDRTKQDFLVLLTVQTMNYLHSGRHRAAL